MKTCSSCSEEKCLTEFPFKNKKIGTTSGKCKACTRLYSKSYYLDNAERYKARSKQHTSRYIKRNVEFVRIFLSNNPCVDCGEPDTVVLEFDHKIPEEKSNDVSRLIYSGVSIASLQAEIDKCEVRCANCHRRRHYYDKQTKTPYISEVCP